MKNYFGEPELKRSSLIIFLGFIIMLAACFTLVDHDYKRIKAAYTRSNMAVLGEIVQAHPELTAEIVPVFTKDSGSEYVEAGKKILASYGYNEDMEKELLPEIKNSYDSLLKSLLFCTALFGLFILAINYSAHAKTYKRLELLSCAAQNITDFNFDIGIYKNAEGVFAKLANSFSNMRIIMKNNYSQIQNEKKFLSDTLSDISHQLKTPIASLVIYNDILLNRKIDDSKRIEFLENSKNQLERIEWLLKSLLQLARLDAGVIEFENSLHDLNSTAQEAVLTLQAKSEQEDINLIFHSSEDKIMLRHDPNWLCEAVINLVKNALEHTSSTGTVEVYTERTPVCVRIIVKDNGEGISKDDLPHIFKRFYKGKTSKKTESVGIGLALSKSIIEGQGGIIEVKSQLSQGTTFTISFLQSI